MKISRKLKFEKTRQWNIKSDDILQWEFCTVTDGYILSIARRIITEMQTVNRDICIKGYKQISSIDEIFEIKIKSNKEDFIEFSSIFSKVLSADVKIYSI